MERISVTFDEVFRGFQKKIGNNPAKITARFFAVSPLEKRANADLVSSPESRNEMFIHIFIFASRLHTSRSLFSCRHLRGWKFSHSFIALLVLL